VTPELRRAHVTHACDLFNAGEYWLAHEALETVWRSIISDGDQVAARVWQGLIQAAAALLHRERGNRHGVAMSKSKPCDFASSWRERSPVMPGRHDWSCGSPTES